ncbi:hypothetical protein C0J52_17733 [Blattella germanica]|nr:hypothetical protein C0J52_17733 [Blattella germanica]
MDRIIGLVTGDSEPSKASKADVAQAAMVEEDENEKSAEVEEFVSEAEDDAVDPKKPPTHPIPLPVPPKLPFLPAIFKPKETITATKTLYAEVTKLVTRHPVCMTVYGVKPPCLPVELHAGHQHGPDCYKREEIDYETGLDEGLYIEPTASLNLIPTTYVQHDVDSPNLEEGDPLDLEPSREGRYLEFHRHTPTTSASAEEVLEETDRLIKIHPPKTHTITQTLWVTKVQKVIDHRITATLEAKNCVPVDPKIPFCHPPHKPHQKPDVVVDEPTHQPVQNPPVIKPTILKPPVVLPSIHKPPFLPSIKPPHLPIIKPPHKPIDHFKEGDNEDKKDEEVEEVTEDAVFEDKS